MELWHPKEPISVGVVPGSVDESIEQKPHENSRITASDDYDDYVIVCF